MSRIRSSLLAVSAGSTVAAIVAYFVFGHRPYLLGLAFLCLLVTIVVYAGGGPGGFVVTGDLRRADEDPPRKPPMVPPPTGPS